MALGSQQGKLYYSISEVCEMTGLEPHVLRYWESEFTQLRPKKNRAGNRAYREKEIDLIRRIRTLLYEEHFTIQGARKRLAEEKDPRETATESRQLGFLLGGEPEPVRPEPAAEVASAPGPAASPSAMREIREGLLEVLRLLRTEAMPMSANTTKGLTR